MLGLKKRSVAPTASRTETGKSKSKKDKNKKSSQKLRVWLVVISGILLLALTVLALTVIFPIGWWYKIVISIAIVTIILSGMVTVPPNRFGVLNRFGARLRDEKGILREGLNFVLPFVDSVELVSMELTRKPVKFGFTAKDGVRIEIQGIFQYRADPDVLKESGPDEGRNIFLTVSEESIVDGINEAVEAALGGLGGKYDHEDFIKSRQALGDIINAILRMGSVAPHLNHKKEGCEARIPMDSEKPKGDSKQCDLPEKIDADDLITFYNTHWREVKEYLKCEPLSTKRSEMERQYGIDIESFDLGNVDFTSETTKALEKEKQVERMAKAADQVLKVAQKFITLGVPAQVALDEAGRVLDTSVKKRILSVQGEAGVLGGIIDGLAGRGGE